MGKSTPKITDDMAKIVNDHKLGYVASVGADGVPNLSPKGTFVVVDGDTLAFAELRSPNTLRNIAVNPKVEVNFVDPFSRKGCRFKGSARFVATSDGGFTALRPLFDGWGDLSDRMTGIVVIDVEKAALLSSPAYDMGVTEETLRAQWTANFRAMQPGGRFAGD